MRRCWRRASGAIVLTHDMLVEGVHYLPDDPAEDVAWKLVAVNLSDLAAKGARPMGVLLGFTLGEEAWDRAFADGLGVVLRAFGIPLLGGDTVSAPARVLGLTAIGMAARIPPSRSGARPGDQLWVSGTIGDAGAGLQALQRGERGAGTGRTLPQSPPAARGRRAARAARPGDDGRLRRPADRCRADGRGERLPGRRSNSTACRCPAPGWPMPAQTPLQAATAGDDYELLFAADPAHGPAILALADEIGLPFTRIGGFASGDGLGLSESRHAGSASRAARLRAWLKSFPHPP